MAADVRRVRHRSAVAARYRDVGTQAFAWMVDPRPAARRFVADVVDAIRVLRAADALRQRGTTQRTSAGYEICVDRRSGRAVMADAQCRLPLRCADVGGQPPQHRRGQPPRRRPDGRGLPAHRVPPRRVQRRRSDRTGRDGDRGDDRRHRGGRARQLPARAGRAAIGVPRRGRRSAGQPGLRAARRRGARARPPATWPGRTVLVDEPHPTPRSEVADWYRRGRALAVDEPGLDECFEQLARHGLNVAGIDRPAALRDVRRSRLRRGEVVLAAGTAASVVVIPLEPGTRVEPIGGYPAGAAPPLAAHRRHGRRAGCRAQRRGHRRCRRRGARDPRRAVPGRLVPPLHVRRAPPWPGVAGSRTTVRDGPARRSISSTRRTQGGEALSARGVLEVAHRAHVGEATLVDLDPERLLEGDDELERAQRVPARDVVRASRRRRAPRRGRRPWPRPPRPLRHARQRQAPGAPPIRLATSATERSRLISSSLRRRPIADSSSTSSSSAPSESQPAIESGPSVSAGSASSRNTRCTSSRAPPSPPATLDRAERGGRVATDVRAGRRPCRTRRCRPGRRRPRRCARREGRRRGRRCERLVRS